MYRYKGRFEENNREKIVVKGEEETGRGSFIHRGRKSSKAWRWCGVKKYALGLTPPPPPTHNR